MMFKKLEILHKIIYNRFTKIFGGVLMSRTEWVIKALEDSNRRSIEYENKNWIRKNAMDMNIRACVENCNVDLSCIEKRVKAKDTFLVQEGKKVEYNSGFNPEKEALLLIKDEYIYYVFQYFPKK